MSFTPSPSLSDASKLDTSLHPALPLYLPLHPSITSSAHHFCLQCSCFSSLPPFILSTFLSFIRNSMKDKNVNVIFILTNISLYLSIASSFSIIYPHPSFPALPCSSHIHPFMCFSPPFHPLHQSISPNNYPVGGFN